MSREVWICEYLMMAELEAMSEFDHNDYPYVTVDYDE